MVGQISEPSTVPPPATTKNEHRLSPKKIQNMQFYHKGPSRSWNGNELHRLSVIKHTWKAKYPIFKAIVARFRGKVA